MIKDNNGFLVDTRYLRDHVLKLNDEKKKADRLYGQIAVMRSMDDPAVSQKYYKILWEIDKLIVYFQRMSDALEHIEQDAIQLSSTIRQSIDDSSDTVRNATSKSFKL